MQTPFDANTRHAVYVERLKSQYVNEITAILATLGNEVFAYVAASDLESLTRRELQKMLTELTQIIDKGYGPVTETIEAHLRDFGVYEAGWQSDMLRNTGLVENPERATDQMVWTDMYNRPFQGQLLAEWLVGLAAGTRLRMRQTVRQGYHNAQTALDVAREIRGTRRQRGVWDKSLRGADVMLRTSMSHTQEVARAANINRNPGIRRVMHVSVLDSRTTAICRALSGEIFKVGSKREKQFRLPLHWGERSVRVPVTNRNRARLEQRETYQDWLGAQSATVQDDILGKKKGKLFRDGGLTLDRFVTQSGNEMTLDQLKAADAEAWREAFGE